jgi:hypothetical protein
VTTSPEEAERRALIAVRAGLDEAVDSGPAAVAAWCGELAVAVEALGAIELAALARAAATAGGASSELLALCRRLCDEGSPATAATLLAGAHRHAPDDSAIALAQVEALGAAGRHDDARRLLQTMHPWLLPDLDRGMALAWHAALDGDLAEAEAWLPRLAASTAPAHRVRAAELAGMIARASAIRGVTALDRRDLRGWHFVITGGLLLHCSPHGRAVMNGRYGFIHDGYDDCLAGIRRAAAVLATWQRPVARVLAPPDRASAALALAAASDLGCRIEPWTDGDDGAGLIVVHDLAWLTPAQQDGLATHHPGQILYVHAASWTVAPPFTPDLVTRLHEHARAPWDSHQSLDATTGDLHDVPGDPAGVELLATRIRGAELAIDALADLPALVELAAAAGAVRGDHAAGGLRDHGRRRPARFDSPVPSARFA